MKKRHNIVDTFDVLKYYNQESFKDYCSACNEDGYYNADSEDDWYKWATYESESDLECFIENLRYSKYFNYSVLVSADLGLWYGRRDAEQRYFDNPIDALLTCVGNHDAVIIDKAGNNLEITGLHHDGRNYFTMTFLNATGEDRYKRNGKVSIKNRENVLKLPEYLF